jgi:hypothetical protein
MNMLIRHTGGVVIDLEDGQADIGPGVVVDVDRALGVRYLALASAIFEPADAESEQVVADLEALDLATEKEGPAIDEPRVGIDVPLGGTGTLEGDPEGVPAAELTQSATTKKVRA